MNVREVIEHLAQCEDDLPVMFDSNTRYPQLLEVANVEVKIEKDADGHLTKIVVLE